MLPVKYFNVTEDFVMRSIYSLSPALSAIAVLSLLALADDTRAGMENLDTGEQCWGQDCSDMAGGSQPSTGNGGYSTLPNVSIYDCNDGETEKIDQSVRWLQQNMAALDAQMGRNGLMDWPGNSRENFEEKLSKDLKFYCINHKNKCTRERDSMLGKVYPGVAQKRINLCTQNMRDVAELLGIPRQSFYVQVVAHEIGHLVRLNAHRSNCLESFTNARFSQAVGLAADAAHRAITYNAAQWQDSWCGVGDFEAAGGQDVIDNKLQEPPLTAN
jgi:hypothetical protein